jgi:CheY-like chemotaxis protein/anti-sigma regulatory factor (Ser/Thr protein kinase)
MVKALVVDDSKVDRLLIGGLLEQDGEIEVSYASDGAEALTKIEQSRPDLVITDLVMPDLDGLALVGEIRRRFPLVPVILCTSKGSEQTAVEALKRGAASYVPKRLLASDLLETVDQVLSSSAQQRCRSEVMESMVESESTFEIKNDRRLFSPLISYLQECLANLGALDEADRTRIGVALEEALVNAAEHGNLELDSALRATDRKAYVELAERRRSRPPYCDRRVFVSARLSRREARFVVRDEGAGFDPGTLPDPRDPENLLKVSGRGVLIMRTFMDQVTFSPEGNEVTLVKLGAPAVAADGAGRAKG